MASHAERTDLHAGALLARVRKLKGIGQAELATSLGDATLVDVRRWELGREPIPERHRATLVGLFRLWPGALDPPPNGGISMHERELLNHYGRASKDTRTAVRRILMLADEQGAVQC